MTTTVLEEPKAAASATVQQTMVEVPLDQVEPSPFNRKKFNEKMLEELAGSIVVTNGVIEPVVMRPVNKGNIKYQLVAGERRWLASKRAVEKMGFQRKTITSVVKQLTDAQAIEITLIENAQREDVHPLELCRTYKALMGEKDSTTGQPYTRELIAERVKKSYSLVCNILQADQLLPDIQKACIDGKINGSIALEICKYQPADQEKIFLQCFGGGREDKTLKDATKDKEAEASVSVRRLREWIANNIHIDLTKAPFKTDDETLLKGVTSCVKCPKRTGSDPGLFADTQEVKKGDTCTDPGCYSAKKEAFIQIRITEEQSKAAAHVAEKIDTAKPVKGMGPTFSQSASTKATPKTDAKKAGKELPVQKISQEDEYNVSKKEKGVLYDGEFTIATAKCQLTQKAIWVDGKDIGKLIDICVEDNCQAHGYRYSGGGGGGSSRPAVTFERRVEIWNQRVQLVHRDSLAKAILEKKPLQWGEEETQIVAQQLIALTAYQDQNKLRRILDLGTESEFGQSKLKNHAKKLKGVELLRFILVVALAPEFGLDDQYFGGNLKSSDPLAVVAGNYNVAIDKSLADAKAALEKKRPKSKAEKAAILKAKEKGKTDALAKAQKKVNVVVKQIQKRGAKTKKKKGKK